MWTYVCALTQDQEIKLKQHAMLLFPLSWLCVSIHTAYRTFDCDHHYQETIKEPHRSYAFHKPITCVLGGYKWKKKLKRGTLPGKFPPVGPKLETFRHIPSPQRVRPTDEVNSVSRHGRIDMHSEDASGCALASPVLVGSEAGSTATESSLGRWLVHRATCAGGRVRAARLGDPGAAGRWAWWYVCCGQIQYFRRKRWFWTDISTDEFTKRDCTKCASLGRPRTACSGHVCIHAKQSCRPRTKDIWRMQHRFWTIQDISTSRIRQGVPARLHNARNTTSGKRCDRQAEFEMYVSGLLAESRMSNSAERMIQVMGYGSTSSVSSLFAGKAWWPAILPQDPGGWTHPHAGNSELKYFDLKSFSSESELLCPTFDHREDQKMRPWARLHPRVQGFHLWTAANINDKAS